MGGRRLQRRLSRRVPQSGLHHLHVSPARSEQAGEVLPTIVVAEVCGQTGHLGTCRPDGSLEHPGAELTAELVHEDRRRLPACHVRGQLNREASRDRYGPPSRLTLERFGRILHRGRDNAPHEVNIGNPQPAGLGDPEAGERSLPTPVWGENSGERLACHYAGTGEPPSWRDPRRSPLGGHRRPIGWGTGGL